MFQSAKYSSRTSWLGRSPSFSIERKSAIDLIVWEAHAGKLHPFLFFCHLISSSAVGIATSSNLAPK
jgi:hypothetical protein